MSPHEFLNLLWQDKPEEQFILVWTHPDKKSRWFTITRHKRKPGRLCGRRPFGQGLRTGAAVYFR
jgi:hypothetical protein